MSSHQPDSNVVNHRALKMRMRPDLIAAQHRYGGEPYWVIKDPVGLSFFQLREQEFAILSMLDGQTVGVAEIKRQFNQQFAPRQLSTSHLQAFLTRMHRNGLLLSEVEGQAEPLLERQSRRRRQEWISALSNVLAIRFRGFDPDALLNRIARWTRPLFSRGALATGGLIVFAALALVVFRFRDFQDRLPEMESYLNVGNLLGLALVMAGVKILHELGHALACKRFGGECHEMGVMLLVFTPCLYCNVSDAWMLRNRWQRIAISAAGIGVEAVLAAVCTFLWWFSEPGPLNTMFFNVMIVASVGTLVLNGNPLMRYDGYYILSDLVEIPNLAQQSRAALLDRIRRFFYGASESTDPSLPDRHHGFLITYSIAASVYRVFLLVAILWFVHRTLQPYRLEALAALLAVFVVTNMLRGPLVQRIRRLRSPLRRPIRRLRAGVAVLALVAAVWAISTIPVPTFVTVPVVLEYEDAERVYVSIDGTLLDNAVPGQRVEQGESLAVLENLDVRLKTVQLLGQRKQQALLLENLEARKADDRTAASQIPAARAALEDLEQRLRQLERDEARLTLTASKRGTVLPPPIRLLDSKTSPMLPQWSGSPLDEGNRNCFLETGTLFCLIGDPIALGAVMIVDETQIAQLALGQDVRLRIDQTPHQVLEGTISEISRNETDTSGRDAESAAQRAARPDGSGDGASRGTTYLVRVTLVDAPEHLLSGARGNARVVVASRTLWWQVARYLGSTFHFEM